MTDAELLEGYAELYRNMEWDLLVDNYFTYMDFPKLRYKDGDVAELLIAEYHRRHAEGTAGR